MPARAGKATDPMARALEFAGRALGACSPNPAVGAVLLAPDGSVAGEGFTQPPPGDHAEIVALRQAGDRARDGALYVTLEPCCHRGRTPPCTQAIIAAAVARVHYSLDDPDPKVAGGGRRALEAAAIAVTVGERDAQARRLNEAYFKHRTTGLPFVIAKFAASLDGRIAAASGESRWLSGPEARDWAHRLRSRVDAILVGSSTVIIDDPLLTPRPGEDEGQKTAARQPLRVVVDTRGRIPPTARVLSGPPPTLVAAADDAPAPWRAAVEAAGAEILPLPKHGDHVDLQHLLQELARRDVLSLLVEGGGVVLGSFFDRALVDKVHALIAPIIIGAAGAPAAVAGRGAYRIADVLRLRDLTVERLGDDIIVTGYPQYPVLSE